MVTPPACDIGGHSSRSNSRKQRAKWRMAVKIATVCDSGVVMRGGQATEFCGGCGRDVDRDVGVAGVVLDSNQSMVPAAVSASAGKSRTSAFECCGLLPQAGQTAGGYQGNHSIEGADAKRRVRRIADTFNRRHARHKEIRRRMTVGKSFVADTLRRHRYEVEVMRRRIKHRVSPPLPRNLVWAMDLTGKTDATGRPRMILGLLDHGSRGLLTLAALPDKGSWTLLGHLFLAMGKYGRPRAVRTDNEACFTGRVFRFALMLAGIRQQRSDPGCPWQNGRIERLFGTLKQKLDQWEVAGFEALNVSLGEFRFWYNQVRPHQHLGKRPANPSFLSR